jgi:hypothetical protein
VAPSAIESSPRYSAVRITFTVYLPSSVEDQTMSSSSVGIPCFHLVVEAAMGVAVTVSIEFDRRGSM